MAISQVNSQIDMSHSASVIEKQKNDLSSGNLDSKEEIKKLSRETKPCHIPSLNTPRKCYFGSKYQCSWNDRIKRCDIM